MAGSVVRRRQRMLRSVWRHEQINGDQIALAEKLHHSAYHPVLPKEEEEVEQHYAL